MEKEFEIREKEIEALTTELKAFKEIVLKEDNIIKEKVYNLLQSYSDNKLYVNTSIKRKHDDYWRVEIGFINENDKTDFGSTFTLYIYTKDVRSFKKGVHINHGTIGEWCVEDDKYQWLRIKLIDSICENRNIILQQFIDLEKTLDNALAYEEKVSELHDLEYALKRDKREYECNIIDSKIRIGTVIQWGENYFIKVSKITPKRIYYFKGSYLYDWEKGEYDRSKISYSAYDKNIIDKERVINSLYMASKGEYGDAKIIG